jgi:hypothetical protein
MSLDDLLNPNDGSMIDRLDIAIFELNKRIATKWQDKTYRPKRDLETALYLGGSIALASYVADSLNVFMLIPASLMTLKGLDKFPRPKGMLYQEIKYMASGLPRKMPRYFYVSLYCSGVLLTAFGVGYLSAGAMTGDVDWFKKAFTNITFGLGTFSWLTADYISRSNLDDPPPKPKRKPLMESIKARLSTLMPQPMPNPASGMMYCGIKY